MHQHMKCSSPGAAPHRGLAAKAASAAHPLPSTSSPHQDPPPGMSTSGHCRLQAPPAQHSYPLLLPAAASRAHPESPRAEAAAEQNRRPCFNGGHGGGDRKTREVATPATVGETRRDFARGNCHAPGWHRCARQTLGTVASGACGGPPCGAREPSRRQSHPPPPGEGPTAAGPRTLPASLHRPVATHRPAARPPPWRAGPSPRQRRRPRPRRGNGSRGDGASGGARGAGTGLAAAARARPAGGSGGAPGLYREAEDLPDSGPPRGPPAAPLVPVNEARTTG